jgi:hypothetical protein
MAEEGCQGNGEGGAAGKWKGIVFELQLMKKGS